MHEQNAAKIHFYYQAQPFYFPNRANLKRFLLDQFRSENKPVEAVNYIFCTDEQLLQINEAYLKHDTYTDIITFELSEKRQPLLADIYISVERVRDNASIYCQPFIVELHRVVFHGALHVLGYSDKSMLQRKNMRTKEEEWLSLYNVSRGKVRPKD